MDSSFNFQVKVGELYLQIFYQEYTINIKGFTSIAKKNQSLVYDVVYKNYNLPVNILDQIHPVNVLVKMIDVWREKLKITKGCLLIDNGQKTFSLPLQKNNNFLSSQNKEPNINQQKVSRQKDQLIAKLKQQIKIIKEEIILLKEKNPLDNLCSDGNRNQSELKNGNSEEKGIQQKDQLDSPINMNKIYGLKQDQSGKYRGYLNLNGYRVNEVNSIESAKRICLEELRLSVKGEEQASKTDQNGVRFKIKKNAKKINNEYILNFNEWKQTLIQNDKLWLISKKQSKLIKITQIISKALNTENIKLKQFKNHERRDYFCIRVQSVWSQMISNQQKKLINKSNENYVIKKYKNGKYKGEINKNDQREGRGIYNYADGDRYQGEFRNDSQEGRGIYYYNDGDRYEGQWKHGKSQGRGVYYYATGARYEGDYKNDQKDGKGIYYYADGDRYEGQYKNGKSQGLGTYYQADGNRYEGQWKNGDKHGRGIYYYVSGARYEGQYKMDQKDGRGVYYYADGDRYDGQWKNSKSQGKGVYYYADGDKYVGQYKNDYKEGKGVFYYAGGTRYEGQYKKDKAEGKGVYYYKNGARYVGEFKNGKSDGRGIYYYGDGDRYEGEFKNDKQDGKGIFYYENGDSQKRLYKNGQLVKK